MYGLIDHLHRNQIEKGSGSHASGNMGRGKTKKITDL